MTGSLEPAYATSATLGFTTLEETAICPSPEAKTSLRQSDRRRTRRASALDARTSVRPVEAGVAHAHRGAAGALRRVGVGWAGRQRPTDADPTRGAKLARVGAGEEVPGMPEQLVLPRR